MNDDGRYKSGSRKDSTVEDSFGREKRKQMFFVSTGFTFLSPAVVCYLFALRKDKVILLQHQVHFPKSSAEE